MLTTQVASYDPRESQERLALRIKTLFSNDQNWN